MTRAAIYARYSSNNQRDASIEDQVRLCKRAIEKEGWAIGEVYSDHAISGASTLRPGYQKMLEDALKKARYNKTRAADLLGISFRSFRYKLKKFDID